MTTTEPVAGNGSLAAARTAQNNEYYTRWVDIEREMNAYLDYDSDVFRDKTILLPCDDPEWSNFANHPSSSAHISGRVAQPPRRP